ncbi:MAG: response regulator transcription factor [Bacteroidetes bacterium]|nr:MAG: response regulator transcription factor [Bacteroidota bacterium]
MLNLEKMKHPLQTPDMELDKEEIAVLQGLAAGKTIPEISVTLSLTPKSVEIHRQMIMEKLQLFTLADLTKYALQNKLTPLN